MIQEFILYLKASLSLEELHRQLTIVLHRRENVEYMSRGYRVRFREPRWTESVYTVINCNHSHWSKSVAIMLPGKPMSIGVYSMSSLEVVDEPSGYVDAHQRCLDCFGALATKGAPDA